MTNIIRIPEKQKGNAKNHVPGPGSWVLGPGSWVLGSGFWVLGSGSWVIASFFTTKDSKVFFTKDTKAPGRIILLIVFLTTEFHGSFHGVYTVSPLITHSSLLTALIFAFILLLLLFSLSPFLLFSLSPFLPFIYLYFSSFSFTIRNSLGIGDSTITALAVTGCGNEKEYACNLILLTNSADAPYFRSPTIGQPISER